MENISAGRTQDGRFAQGNKGGPGNPYAQQAATFRALLAEMLTEGDIRDVIKALIKRAKEGYFPAIKMILEKFIGKPENSRGQGGGLAAFLPSLLSKPFGDGDNGRCQGLGVNGQDERVPAWPAMRSTATAEPFDKTQGRELVEQQASSGTVPQVANDKTPPPKSAALRTILEALNPKPNNPSFHLLSAGVKFLAEQAEAGKRLPAHAFSR